MTLDPTVIAVIGTIMGGVGLKVVEHWLGRSQVKVSDAGKLRDELRLEITALRKENSDLEKDVDSWREKYYKAYGKLILIKSHMTLYGLSPPEDLDDE